MPRLHFYILFHIFQLLVLYKTKKWVNMHVLTFFGDFSGLGRLGCHAQTYHERVVVSKYGAQGSVINLNKTEC